MKFKEYENEQEFLEEIEARLLYREDLNNTILGIIPQVEKDKFFFRIEEEEKVYLIGLITKTERKGLLVYFENYDKVEETCEILVNEIIERNVDLKEIKAPKGVSELIFDLYSKKKEVTIKSTKYKYLMKLNNLNEKYDTNAIIRKATMEDIEFEKEMVLCIFEETLEEEVSDEKAYEVAKIFINKGLYFLVDENGEILSQACTTRESKNGYTIGAVYTPLDKRRKGYARTCLYKLLSQLKDEGKDVLILYTNATKAQNRALYESIGFEIVLEETIIKL